MITFEQDSPHESAGDVLRKIRSSPLEYETDPPFKATFRFYGVDQATGLPASFYLELFEGGSSTVATDLSGTIDDSPRPVNVNEPLTYTLVVTNIGAE